MGVPYAESPTLSPSTTASVSASKSVRRSQDAPTQSTPASRSTMSRSSLVRSWFQNRRLNTSSTTHDDEDLPEAVYPDAAPRVRQSAHWRAENAPQRVKEEISPNGDLPEVVHSASTTKTLSPYFQYPLSGGGGYTASEDVLADKPKFFLPWASVPLPPQNIHAPRGSPPQDMRAPRGPPQLVQITSPQSDMVSALSPPNGYGYSPVRNHYFGRQNSNITPPYYMGALAGAASATIGAGSAASAALYGSMPVPGASPAVPKPAHSFPISHWSPETTAELDSKAFNTRSIVGEKGEAKNSPNRRKWLLLGLGALVALIVIGLAIGLGIALNHRGGAKSTASSSSENSPTSSPTSGDSGPSPNTSIMHPLTQMTSLNFTDQANQKHRAVAWQDRYNHIIISHFDPLADSWSIVNVTGDMSVPVRPLAGTPIALNAKSYDSFGRSDTLIPEPFHLNIYFADEGHNLYEMLTYDAGLANWSLGQLSYAGLAIRPGSGLAAFWAPYFDSGYMPLIFIQNAKDPDAIRAYVFDIPSGQWQDKGRVAEVSSPSTFFATPFYDVREDDGRDVEPDEGNPSVRMYYTHGGMLSEVSPWGGGYGWTYGRTIGAAPVTNISVAAIGWGPNRWTQLLTATVQANDPVVRLSWWTPTADVSTSEWRNMSPTYLALDTDAARKTGFSDRTKLQAVSLAQNMRAYVATAWDEAAGSGGEILEFEVSTEKAYEWTFKGVVGIA